MTAMVNSLRRGFSGWPVLILAMALALRLPGLGQRAFHHDESIHAVTALQRLADFQHVYEPLYHGPFLYYATALIFVLGGVSETTARLLPVAAGMALIASTYWLWREYLGTAGTTLAMLALSLSTGFLHYSRFLRNDILIALFTLLAFGALVRYVQRPQRRWMILAGAALGLSVASKENAYITGFIFVSYILLLGIAVAIDARRPGPSATLAGPRAAFRALLADPLGLAMGVLATLIIPALFFSSFAISPQSVLPAIADSVSVWAEVHLSERLDQPWWYYGALIFLFEPFAAIGALVGIACILRRPDWLGALLAYWLVSSMVIYSLAGEKAAWLALHPLLPMVLLSARTFGSALGATSTRRWIAIAAAIVLLGLTARHAIAVSNIYGDVARTPITYAQTSRDLLGAIDLIDEAARRSGQGQALPIYVDSDAHWPMVWYLRNYSEVEYGEGLPDLSKLSPQVAILNIENVDASGFLLPSYTGVEFSLREWFPERIYKNWDWSALGQLFSDGANVALLANFVAWHDPPAPIGGTDMFIYLHDELAVLGLQPGATLAGSRQ